MFDIKVCRWPNLNRGPLVLETIALPTDPQPLPQRGISVRSNINYVFYILLKLKVKLELDYFNYQ